MKAAVEKNQGKRKKSQPQMTAHPRLRASKSPSRHSFACAERRRKNHECKSNNAKRETNGAATSGSSRCRKCIWNVSRNRNNKNRDGNEKPQALSGIHSHFNFHPRLTTPWKNWRGSTR